MAEVSHNPGSIDVDEDRANYHLSSLYPNAPPFLIKRIVERQKILCERLRKARVPYDITTATLASSQAPKLVNPNNQVGASLPKPPAQTFPAKFECPLCFQVINLSTPYEWTRHVREDLESFPCTYKECGDLESFKRRSAWSRHENDKHRQVDLWVCGETHANQKNHGGVISYICLKGHVHKGDLEEHLKRVHKFGDMKAKEMAEKCHYMKTNPGDTRQRDL
jgi:hypothetical protein